LVLVVRTMDSGSTTCDVVEVVSANFLPGGSRPWLRVVGERLGFAEGIENGGGVVVETAMRRIGSGEIRIGFPRRGSPRVPVRDGGRELPVVR